MADNNSEQDGSIQKEGFSSSRGQFKHRRLDLGKTQIRLFRLLDCEEEWLLASTSEDFLHGEIAVYDMEKCPMYEALSYTWGPPQPCREIIISNHTFLVRENLWQFLESTFHSVERPSNTWFWIDQICIDQSEVEERNHQVSLMSSIYQKAALVLVWLGPEADGSDNAMGTIAFPSEGSLTRYEDDMDCLLQRPYWSRLWILQEILLAKNIHVLCGKKMVHWDRLENLLLIPGLFKGDEMSRPSWIHDFMMGYTGDKVESALAIVEERSQFDGKHGQRLSYLLDTFGNLQCQDVRDKVYGLLSLAGANTIAIDYSKTPIEVWRDALSWIVVDEKFLSVSSHAEIGRRLCDAMMLNEISDEYIESFIKERTKIRINDEALEAHMKPSGTSDAGLQLNRMLE